MTVTCSVLKTDCILKFFVTKNDDIIIARILAEINDSGMGEGGEGPKVGDYTTTV